MPSHGCETGRLDARAPWLALTSLSPLTDAEFKASLIWRPPKLGRNTLAPFRRPELFADVTLSAILYPCSSILLLMG